MCTVERRVLQCPFTLLDSSPESISESAKEHRCMHVRCDPQICRPLPDEDMCAMHGILLVRFSANASFLVTGHIPRHPSTLDAVDTPVVRSCLKWLMDAKSSAGPCNFYNIRTSSVPDKVFPKQWRSRFMLWRLDSRHRKLISIAEVCHSCFLNPFRSRADAEEDSPEYRTPPAPSPGYVLDISMPLGGWDCIEGVQKAEQRG